MSSSFLNIYVHLCVIRVFIWRETLKKHFGFKSEIKKTYRIYGPCIKRQTNYKKAIKLNLINDNYKKGNTVILHDS